MTVISQINSFLFCILKINSFLCIVIVNINTFVMAKCISSVVITLSPKRESSFEPLVSKVLILDYVSGSSVSAAIHFVKLMYRGLRGKDMIVSISFRVEGTRSNLFMLEI
jgi:hypothetical protein